MSTAVVQQPAAESAAQPTRTPEVVIYSHSPIFYWWPVWAVGYLFAVLTLLQGVDYAFNDGVVQSVVKIHPSRTLGVVFTFTFLMVIAMTHFTVRGLASVVVIVSAIAITLGLAYFQLWEPLMRALGHLAIFMNLGFYVFFSTAIFIVWAQAVFIFDRSTYYLFRPGQMVKGGLFGAGEETYDTHGMTVDKKRDDLFRHWVLGLGSGDIIVATTGARKTEFVIPNVLFVGSKIAKIQELVALRPDHVPNTVMSAGEPV
jgi:hypothetical protein